MFAIDLGPVTPCGSRRHYRLEPPLRECRVNQSPLHHCYVVVSTTPDGGETAIFPADGIGTVTRWTALEGIQRDGAGQREALLRAGYEVIG